jgi:NADH pyrophosphatase NudC (nudix superfamily)
MTTIHYGVHITLGIIVLIVSVIQSEMRIFAVAGIGFIIWGLIRLAIVKSELKKKNSNKKNNYHQHSAAQSHLHKQQQHHVGHQINTQQMYNTPAQHTHHNKYKICPNCQAIIDKGYRFCPHCGYGV